MVYIQSWQEYQDAAEALYAKSPVNTRYCVKWKASEGKLVLKITDNTSCIKFKTYSSIFLNRFETLNLSLMEKMQNRRTVVESTPTQLSSYVGEKVSHAETAAAPAISPSGAIPTPSASGGGVKKKKPKKRKGG
ncbi:signal recognition particle, SRP9/SRP14 subunit [Guyanagaster necrorhizus]|uniref:Signal recognition particle, SRP9/SRP14 subunit n=1 Tax=Guyanagaster necrorhizus TaxID=856835 RepID=A0A9P7VKL5_9AGAR|nr:signal recognition particle, SRP9/SRP14 subunit [Guyanagaster necrorhizus MCA 3950]KAG7442080.1 signal recognition particle, SRP9/SRP14 subunit [Guyanagaster necrorhizus MCA 3950]